MGKEATAEKIWAGIVEGADGGTYDTTGEALPTTGFVVGGVTNSLVAPRALDEIIAFLSRQADGLVGFWRDSVSGLYHVDACTWHVNRGHALGVAKRRGELAIFDVLAGAELPVRY